MVALITRLLAIVNRWLELVATPRWWGFEAAPH